jgi:hypothetical protein
MRNIVACWRTSAEVLLLGNIASRPIGGDVDLRTAS